jgi:hypothetical protein
LREGLTCRGLTQAGGQDATHEHLLDPACVEARAGEGTADGGRTEIGGSDARQFTHHGADGGAGGGNDDDRIIHGGSPSFVRNRGPASRPAAPVALPADSAAGGRGSW